MEYYNILNFKKEPFSNSPEPEFLFSSPQHTECLQKLELSVRLRRGLNVIIGDIGTGKTTLCRKLLQNLSPTAAEPTEIETHLLLDPSFDSAVEFLQTICAMLGIEDAQSEQSEWQLKEKIKNYLFIKGVDEDKIVVLVIDEGQKISGDCLEILREFLNYETNDFKLLQIIIFAQKELQTILAKRPNLADRINVFYYLKPLNFKQMQAMIKYRLAVARNFEIAPPIFSYAAYAAIYLATGGYPRKVVTLCHDVILKMIIRNRHKAGWFLVRSCVNDMAAPFFRKLKWSALSLILVLALILPVKAIISEYKNEPLGTGKIALPADVVENNQPSASILQGKNEVSASQNIPPASEIQEPPEPKMPAYLGVLKIKKGMNLWWTLYNIYGETGYEIIDEVVRVNPQIRHRDKIEEGYFITLPSIPAEKSPFEEGKFVLVFAEGANIETIYDFYLEHRYQNAPYLMFSPYWDKRENKVKFSVVMDRNFNTEEEAQATLNKLPKQLAQKAKIVSPGVSDVVYFSRRAMRS